MSVKDIKGINVEIGGNVTKLDEAIKKSDTAASSLQKELTQVNKLLKFDPKNTELLAQKQKLLAQEITETKSTLKTLQTAQQQYVDSGKDLNTPEYRALEREIVATEQKIKGLETQQKQFQKTTAKALEDAGGQMTKFGDKAAAAGKKMLTVTAGVIGIGAAAIASFNEVDDGMDTIIKKTGASGDAASALKNDYQNLASNSTFALSNIGAAIGEVNTRFGDTGQQLQDTSRLFLEFAEINEADVTTSIANTSKIMQAWNVDQSKTGELLGMITAKGQETGISIDTLMSTVLENNSTFKEMGLTLEQSINLMASFEQNGVNSGTALAGLKKAVANYTKQGLSMDDALKATVSSIKDASSETEALTTATEIFGAKGAAEMTNAIREGRISFDDISGSMADYGSVVADTFDGTQDGIDKYKVALNSAKVAMSELGATIGEALAPILQRVSTIIQNIAGKFSNLSQGQKNAVLIAGALVAAIGPLLIIIGKMSSGVGVLMKVGAKIIPLLTGAGSAAGGAATATGLLGKAMVVLTGPIGIAIAAIAALVATCVYLFHTNQAFHDKVIEVWENVKSKIMTVVETVKPLLSTFADFFGMVWETIKKIFDAAMQALAPILTSLFNLFNTVFNKIYEKVMPVVQFLVDFIQQAWAACKDGVGTILNGIFIIFKGVFDLISATVSGIVKMITDIVNGDFDQLKIDLWNTLQGIWQAITTIWNGILTYLTGLMQVIGGFVTTAWNSFFAVISGACSSISNVIQNIWNGILGFFSGIPSTLMSLGSSMFNSMADGISSMADSVYNAATGCISSAIEWIKGLPGQAITWGSDMINGFANGIYAAAQAVVDRVKSIASTIASYLHFSCPDVGPLSEYESWMPDFMQGLAAGIERNKFKVVEAVKGLTSDMAVNVGTKATSTSAFGTAGGSTMYQTNYISSPKALTPSETARQVRTQTQRMVAKLKK